MKELQRWLDMAPTLRRCSVQFNHDGGPFWSVSVWAVGPENSKGTGEGCSSSLLRAAVVAIMDWERLEA